MRLGPQGTSRVASGNSSHLSSCEGQHRIALESLQGNRASSRIEGESHGVSRVSARSFRFLSSCDGDLREPLISGKSSLLSSFKGHLRIPLMWLQGYRASSQFEARNSGVLSSCYRTLRVPIEVQ